jgi:hypothetical protein
MVQKQQFFGKIFEDSAKISREVVEKNSKPTLPPADSVGKL